MRRCAAALPALLLAFAAQAQDAPAPVQQQQQEQETPPPPAWLPRPAARLVLLDKISAQPHSVTVQVGQSVTFGALTVGVRACDVRPPDQPADATAFLDLSDSHAGMPGFHGWMFADEPAANMFEHPVYDVRLAGCAG
ncbi:MAG: DUF2155 domain-containing protein [Rhodospirillales bacterium]|nr:DUF2155 domain-containing protein [Rhodospirillales bacterium]